MKNPHQIAVEQLESVAKILEKSYPDNERFKKAIKKLAQPDRVIEGELAILMDDGSNKSFTAFRSQHDNARGPYKGGIRFHHNVSKEEVMALSTWMTWKCAVTGIPYGGGKGGIIVDPRTLSEAELQRLSRAYARFVAEAIGPWTDIPAPDVNTTGQIMAWMVDEYEKVKRETDGTVHEDPLATFTGKPVGLGGSQGRDEATGLGGVMILERLVKKMGLDRKQDITIAVQGFGNVGYWFAHHADIRGYRVVAVSDSKGGIYLESGLNPEKTLKCKQETGSLSKCHCNEKGCSVEAGKVITNEELLELDVDILVPAALESVITKENAGRIKAQAIIEMANGPTTPEADEILAKNNVVVMPDVLSNAGGVTVSYFEWVQNLQGYYWSHQEVLQKLEPLMQDAFEATWGLLKEHSLDGRMAAYSLAVKRVIDTMMLRGRV